MLRYKPGQCVQWTTDGGAFATSRPSITGYVVSHKIGRNTADYYLIVVNLRGYKYTFDAYNTPVDLKRARDKRGNYKRDAVVLQAKRSDGYIHYAVIAGRKMAIIAGCRSFTTASNAAKHWSTRKRGTSPYNRTATVWSRSGKFRKTYMDQRNVRHRAKDKRLNKFSLAFVRKAERVRTKS